MENKKFSPFVSIIMPIKNEGRYIKRSLEAVLDQDYLPEKFEILIADGNSTDETRAIIAEMIPDAKVPIYLLDNPSWFVPQALNLCLEQARGDVIIRVDGHCVIQKDYVSTCVFCLDNQAIDCVGGSIKTIGETYLAEVIALAMGSPFGVGGVAFRVGSKGSKFVDSVPFPAYRKDIFDQIGLFDEDMRCNEDDEFNYRLLENGGKILLVDKLQTRYYSRGSFSSLWRQYFRYGLWKVRILQKYPKQMRPRQFIPLLFILALLLSLLLMVIFPWGWISMPVLLGLYLSANLMASSIIANRVGWRYFWSLPLVFATLHLSYGTGVFVGLFKFWHHWGGK